MNEPTPYIGRFAPSPTGDLHFGSLLAAVASYLQAKSHEGLWLVRIEDIDPPREVPGSADRLLKDLERFGLTPDQPTLFQSSRIAAYVKARQSLLDSGKAFFCRCSRKSLPSNGIYPGTCRAGIDQPTSSMSVRIKTSQQNIKFQDKLQGMVCENLATVCGDFVIWRADDLPAYQLAVVIDDAFQDVTEVVRGADLLDSTSRQIFLQQAMGLPTPAYVHLPVATSGGQKLSKREQADPVSAREPAAAIYHALNFLGQNPPRGLELDALWNWAIEHWSLQSVQAVRKIAFEGINGV